MKIVITLPSSLGKGGVSNYYNSVLPFLSDEINYRISCVEIGSVDLSYKLLHPLIDQVRVYKAISNNKAELLHVNPSLDAKSLFRDGMFVYWALRRRLPVLVFFHGWDISFEPHIENRLRWFFKKTFMQADAFIVLASAFKEKLRKWGIDAPIHLATTTIDEQLLSDFSIAEKVNLLKTATKIKILFLSRIEEKKGIFETIDAVRILISRGQNVSLSIAGDGSAMKEVLDYLHSNNLRGDDVTLLGYVSGQKKKSVFDTHHIYCFPSHGEGMPTSLLEAMSFGMPVITRPVGGIRDFFRNGKMGYLTEKKDPEVIAELIENLISNKNKMVDMALYNHEYAKERFSASKVARRIKRIYEKTFDEKDVIAHSSLG